MASIFDIFGGMSPEQNQGLLAAAAHVLRSSGPSRQPYTLGMGIGDAIGAYDAGIQDARHRAAQEKLLGVRLRDAEADFANQQMLREQKLRIGKRLAGLPTSGDMSAASPETMASAMPGGENSPKVGGPSWLQAYQQLNGLTLPQASAGTKPLNQTDAYVQRLLTTAQVYAEEGDLDGANKLYEQAAKLRPKVKEFQKVKRDGKVLNQPFFEDGTVGDALGDELAQNLNWQDIGGETVGLDPTYGNVVARQANTVSPNTIANVAASRENATATRAVAEATRDAARMQRDQATEMKLADDYRTQSKGFKETSDAYLQLNATLGQASKSPAATLAAATKFMKLLDPGSVVRESELGMALQASGVLDRAMNYFNVLQNGRVLTPTQVADFKNITGQIYKAAQQGQQTIDANYRRQAQAYGLRPEMIVQDLGQNKPAKGSASAQAYSDPEKERRYQEWKRSQGK